MRTLAAMTEVTGIDHVYIAVSDPARSEAFYDLVMLQALGFRKNTFIVAGDPHVPVFQSTLRLCAAGAARPP
jgi:glyoxylase I family protein